MTFNKNVLLGLVAVFTLTYAHGAGQNDRQINAEKIKNGSGILTLPTTTDTLVGRATTDTLTNKSISGSTNTLSAIPRASVSAGTASHVLVNDGSGLLSSEAVLSKTRGGTGYDLTTQAAELPEIATPSTPASGFGRVYFKSDGKLYQINDAGTETQVGSGSGGGIFAGGQNLISNNSFEENTTGWTASGGTFQRETGAANLVLPGVAGASWDPSATSQTLSFTATTITANDGISGRNGVLSCAVKTAATDLKMQAYDGTNVLSPNAAEHVVPSSSAGFVRYSVNFIFPSSGTVQARFLSQSDSAIAYIDDCYFGLSEGFNISNVSQSQFVGSAYIDSTSCTPSRTSATLGALTDDTDCPGPTVQLNPGPGVIQTTDANNYEYTVNNLPPGIYVVTMTGAFVVANAVDAEFTISDGTTATGFQGGDSGSANWPGMSSVKAAFMYTSSGNRTFEFFVKSTSGAITGQDGSKSYFMIERYPLTSEQALRPDLINRQGSIKYAGVASCQWSTTSGSYSNFSADTDCNTASAQGSATAPGTKIPGGTFSNIMPGTYLALGLGSFEPSASTTTTNCSWRLHDGTNGIGGQTSFAGATYGSAFGAIGGVVTYSSIQSSLTIQAQGVRNAGDGDCRIYNGNSNTSFEIVLIPISQNINSPVLVGSVTSTSTGSERIERVRLAAPSGGTCAVTSESGDWINGTPTSSGTGICAITFNSGVFSAAPSCSAMVEESSGKAVTFGSLSSTGITTTVFTTSSGSASDDNLIMICMGPR